MSAQEPSLPLERELGRLARRVRQDGLPHPHRPEATMALALAVRDVLRDTALPDRAARAGALVCRVLERTVDNLPRPAAGQAIACRPGCAYCCHKTVMATAPEVFFAAAELRARRGPAFRAEVEARCAAAVAPAGAPAGRVRPRPCPLLEDDRCSVYAARPTVCRKHTSFAVAACLADYQGTGTAIPIRRHDQEAFECCAAALMVGMRLWAGGPHRGRVLELRGALAVALREPQAEARWLAGEDVFAAVAGQRELPGIDGHAAFLWTRFVEPAAGP